MYASRHVRAYLRSHRSVPRCRDCLCCLELHSQTPLPGGPRSGPVAASPRGVGQAAAALVVLVVAGLPLSAAESSGARVPAGQERQPLSHPG
eukprot:13583054-Alexandrium_andersonii.AAC.1